MKLALAIYTVVVLSHVSATPRITPFLQAAFKTQSSVDIMIEMKSNTAEVLQRVRSQSFINMDQKATTLYNELRKFTANSQKEVLSIISSQKTGKVQGFYLTNKISVKSATLELVETLSGRSDIAEIREEKVIYLEETRFANVKSSGKAVQWGVENIGAPAAWSNNITGEGIVVSHIDTGVRYTHEALIDGYRTEYGWFDPYEGTELPNDANTGFSHGTHTMGTMAGRDGNGVAPGATWIACKGCTTSECSESSLVKCFEWTFCPTRPNNTGADCTKRPHVSSNSWAGGSGDTSHNELIDAWNEVGIIPVFGMGNEGPSCGSANSPGDQPNLIGVGATDKTDAVAEFSSRGPSVNDLIKPDVSAPGVDVVSCGIESDTSYASASGTSMATPHVAGAVALLLQKNKSLTLTEIANALENSALRPENVDIACPGGGSDSDNPWPNNSYGYGKIDVGKAVETV